MTDELAATLREIVRRLESHGIDYMLVGSVAALVHGHARSTHDFDMVIEAGAQALRRLVASLPEERFYASQEAAAEALRHQTQFNVIDMETGWKVDLIPRKQRPFSETEFARRTRVPLLGTDAFVATREDTIIAKLEWAKLAGGSERQLEDVRALVRLAGEDLDREYLRDWIAALGLESMWDRVDPEPD